MGHAWRAGEGRTMAAGAVQRMSTVIMAPFAGPLVALPLHVHACWIVASYSAPGPPVPDMGSVLCRARWQTFSHPAIQPSSHPAMTGVTDAWMGRGEQGSNGVGTAGSTITKVST